MSSHEPSNYIQKSRENNVPDEKIKENLLKKGWSEEVVNKVFSEIGMPVPHPPPPIPPSTAINKEMPKNGMWDAFEHIIMFISLYVLATSIILLLQTFVDKWIPDISKYSSYSYYFNPFNSVLIRGYLAALIVSLPLFSFLFIQITQRTIKNPSIRNLKSRKILIYITLVGTFIVMLSNIIGIVYQLLNGNFSFNFVLKFLIIVGVCAIIFTYYILQIKEDRALYG